MLPFVLTMRLPNGRPAVRRVLSIRAAALAVRAYAAQRGVSPLAVEYSVVRVAAVLPAMPRAA